MQADIHSRTVFGHYQDLSFIDIMRPVQKPLELVYVRLVPSLIQIPSHDHRNFRQMRIFIAGRSVVICHHRISGRIFPADFVLKSLGHLTGKFIIPRKVDCVPVFIRLPEQYLIHIAPYHHARAVEILPDHFHSHVH